MDSNAPLYNKHLQCLLNKKKCLFRSAKKLPVNDCWTDYMTATNQYIKTVKEAKDNFSNTTIPTMLASEPRKSWCTIMKSEDHCITRTNSAGCTIPENACHKVLNEVFSNNFSSNPNPSVPPSNT